MLEYKPFLFWYRCFSCFFPQYWYEGNEMGDLPVDFSIVWDGDFPIDKPSSMRGKKSHTSPLAPSGISTAKEKQYWSYPLYIHIYRRSRCPLDVGRVLPSCKIELNAPFILFYLDICLNTFSLLGVLSVAVAYLIDKRVPAFSLIEPHITAEDGMESESVSF